MGAKRQFANHVEGEVSPQLTVLIVLGEWLASGRSAFWLRELLAVTDNVDVHPRSIRTVVQRLTKNGWFETERAGRESYYRLTPLARRELQRGDARIFHREQPKWDGRWHLLRVTSDLASRETVGRNLEWLGFGLFAPTIWICPWNRIGAARSVMSDIDEAAVLIALSQAKIKPTDFAQLVSTCWNLDAIAAAHQEFAMATSRTLTRWRRYPREHQRAGLLLNLDAAFIDTLRRDPGLPPSLLPDGWPGLKTRALFEEARFAFLHPDGVTAHPFDLLSTS